MNEIQKKNDMKVIFLKGNTMYVNMDMIHATVIIIYIKIAERNAFVVSK